MTTASHRSHRSVEASVLRMIHDARQQYSCELRLNQSNRSATQAQQFHVCHMFLHNYFKHQKPTNLAADGRTIAWSHISSPVVQWALIDDLVGDFLKTRTGLPAERRRAGGVLAWVPGREPDQQASTHAMSDFLARAHVTSMAAPGIDGCGEPCGCGGHASRHVRGLACDVGGMEALGQRILQKTSAPQSPDDAVDVFLASHDLWRPLAHKKGKAREAWHLEALPRRVKVMHRPHESPHHQAPRPESTHPGSHHHDPNPTGQHDGALLAALQHERLSHSGSC